MSLHRYRSNQPAAQNPDAHRSLGTHTLQSSAYERIFSSKNIMTQLIPSFLAHPTPKQGISKLDLLRFDLQATENPNVSDASGNVAPGPIILAGNSSRNSLLSDTKNPDRLIYNVFNPSLPADEVILTINKIKLTRKELLCFKEGFELPDVIIDTYMSILKISNRLSSTQRVCEKIVVISTKYSRTLFRSMSTILKPKTNIFDSNVLFIPFFDEHWSLFVINLKTGLVRYYEAVVTDRDLESLLVILRRFIIKANVNNLPGIDENFLNFERCKNPQGIIMDPNDSGIYICKIAEMIAHNKEIYHWDIRNIRKDMLINLVKVYLKLG